MSPSYPNFPYNPYRYGGAENEQDLAQFSTNRQPPLPAQDYGEASYGWRTQGSSGTSGLNGYPSGNSRGPYSSSQDVYQQGFASHHSGDLPRSQSQSSNSLDNSGLNSLVYVSALESAILKNPAGSGPRKSTEHNVRRDSFQPPARTIPPPNTSRSTASFSGSQHPQQPSRSSPATTASSIPPSVNRNYGTNYSGPYRQAHPSVVSNNQGNGVSSYNNAGNTRVSESFNRQPNRSPPFASRATANAVTSLAAPPTLHGTISDSRGNTSAFSNSEQFNRQGLSTTTASSFTPSIPSSGDSIQNSHLMSPPQRSITHQFPSQPPSNRLDMAYLTEPREPQEQISPPRVQYINPNELYIQQYRLEQERSRAAGAELEARREQDNARVKANEVPHAQTHSSKGQGSTSVTPPAKEANQPAPPSSNQPGNEEEDEDMAVEMRTMLEKLRKYRSKDPATFTKLWEDIKKGQGQTNSPTVSNPPSQGEQQLGTTSPAPVASGAVATPQSQKAQKTSGPLIDGLPDLGRFPAQRRRRGPKVTEKVSEINGENQGINNGTNGQILSQTSMPKERQPVTTGANPRLTPTAPQTVTNRASAPAVSGPTQITQQSSPYQNPPIPRIDGLPDLRKISKAATETPGPATPTTASTTANTTQIAPIPNASGPPVPDQIAVPAPQEQQTSQLSVPNRPAYATWPASAQQKLAQATLEYLATKPANRNKRKSLETVLSLLRSNPTYQVLCERLESFGYVLHRQDMARHLIKAVPHVTSNGNTTQEQKKPEATIMTTATAATATAAAAIALGPSPAPGPSPTPAPPQDLQRPTGPLPNRLVQPSPAPAPQMMGWDPKKSSPQLSFPPAGPSSNPSSKAPASSVHPVKTAQPNTVPKLAPPRASPSALAAPNPGSKEAAARKRLFSEIVDLSQLSDDEDSNPPPKQPRLNEAPVKDPSSGAVEEFSRQPHLKASHASKIVPIQELSLRSTSAVAEASRPDLTPSTQVSSSEALREWIRTCPDIVQPLNYSATLDRVYYNPKTIARDILIASGRHPTEYPLNHHLLHFQDIFSFVSSRSDLETFRWDLVDPGGPPMPIVEPEEILTFPPSVPAKRRLKDSRDTSGAVSRDKTPPASDPSNTTPAPAPAPAPQTSTPSSSVHRTPKGDDNSTMTGANSGSAARRRGRPPGAKNKHAKVSEIPKVEVAIPVSPPVPAPSYPIFQCSWDTCQAQLHDMQTLERHVLKVHVPGQTNCRWHGCPNAMTRYTGLDLRKHVHLAHIQPLAWKLGDGPSVKATVVGSDRYLNDSSGAVITPNAATAAEVDSLIFPVDHTPIRAFNKLRGNQSNVAKAKEVLKAVQHQRRKVGFGLEQGGCEFATPARNKVLSNDEGLFVTVSDDE